MFKILNSPKLICSGQRLLGLIHLGLWSFEFVSDFDIRYSYFLIGFVPRRFEAKLR